MRYKSINVILYNCNTCMKFLWRCEDKKERVKETDTSRFIIRLFSRFVAVVYLDIFNPETKPPTFFARLIPSITVDYGVRFESTTEIKYGKRKRARVAHSEPYRFSRGSAYARFYRDDAFIDTRERYRIYTFRSIRD